jgi:hypothetical protein
MGDLSPQSAPSANFVIPIRVEARHLAWILEHGVVDATGYVVVMGQLEPNLHPEPAG